MTDLQYTAIALVCQLLSCFVAYQYLSNRSNGEIKYKNLLTLKFNLMPALIMGAVFVISAFIMCYCFLLGDNRFVRSLMNAEVFVWLSILAYIDTKERIIPNHMIVVGLAFWAVLVLVDIFVGGTPWQSVLVYSLIGGVVCGGILLIVALIAKSALGMGDVKMFTVIGLLYGFNDTYSILLFSIVIMAIVSIGLLIAKKATRKTAVPMAPFVVAGFLLSILAGM